MTDYRVTWEIDIVADSPRAAAEEAFAIQRDQNSIAVVFDVADEQGEITRVDLEEDEDDDPDPEDETIPDDLEAGTESEEEED